MSFLQKAREAASNAADQARQAAEQARQKATDPSTQERMRQSMQQAGASARSAGSAAKRGLGNMVDKIDPGLLADIVIKATALQEKANAGLRAKGSPYRISEVTITATFPPQVGFSIGRVGDIDEVLTGRELDSSQLVNEVRAEEAAEAAEGIGDGTGAMSEMGLGDDLVTGGEGTASEDQTILP